MVPIAALGWGESASEGATGTRFRLVSGPDPSGPVAEVTDTEVYTLYADAFRNTSFVPGGADFAMRRRYTPFGRERDRVRSAPIERGFAGLPAEGASGLVAMARRRETYI